jgi:hypothetical protein
MAKNAKRASSRRQKYESAARPIQPGDPALAAAWQELQALPDEEIERLREGLRAAFVLCCLGNKGCAEAACQLGLKEATVAVRLSRARRLLHEWLTRRGVSLAAVLAAIAVGAEGAGAAVAACVVASTAEAAVLIAAGQPARGDQSRDEVQFVACPARDG